MSSSFCWKLFCLGLICGVVGDSGGKSGMASAVCTKATAENFKCEIDKKSTALLNCVFNQTETEASDADACSKYSNVDSNDINDALEKLCGCCDDKSNDDDDDDDADDDDDDFPLVYSAYCSDPDEWTVSTTDTTPPTTLASTTTIATSTVTFSFYTTYTPSDVPMAMPTTKLTSIPTSLPTSLPTTLRTSITTTMRTTSPTTMSTTFSMPMPTPTTTSITSTTPSPNPGKVTPMLGALPVYGAVSIAFVLVLVVVVVVVAGARRPRKRLKMSPQADDGYGTPPASIEMVGVVCCGVSDDDGSSPAYTSGSEFSTENEVSALLLSIRIHARTWPHLFRENITDMTTLKSLTKEDFYRIGLSVGDTSRIVRVLMDMDGNETSPDGSLSLTATSTSFDALPSFQDDDDDNEHELEVKPVVLPVVNKKNTANNNNNTTTTTTTKQKQPKKKTIN